MLKETDLAKHVVAWLEAQHWDVYQEVDVRGFSGIADIVAVRASIVWVIECKSSLTFAVLNQAQRWPVHLRSVAVPACERGSDARAAAVKCAVDYFGVGVIEVRVYRGATLDVVEKAAPPLKRCYHKRAKALAAKLLPEHKTAAPAGSIGGGGRWTPWRSTLYDVEKRLREAPNGLTLRELVTNGGKYHYASTASARSGLRAMLENFEKERFEARRDGDSKTVRYYVRAASAVAQ